VKTHDDDPIDQPQPDPWDKMAEQATSLGRKLRETYERSVAGEGPGQDDVRAALRTLGNAAEKVVQAVGAAARDEEVRATMKNAATGFFEAVGAAFSELGSDLRAATSSARTAEDTALDEDLDLDPPSKSTGRLDDPSPRQSDDEI
jgi:hypothetical protein